MVVIADRGYSFRLWSTPDARGQVISSALDKTILLVLNVVEGKGDDMTIGCESAPWVFVLTPNGIVGWMPFVEGYMHVIESTSLIKCDQK